MENLNDVEFGSDKNNEEAPILIAQRHLNIFRQIHIFSKQKRDQFDDELLALPPNVTDFFKRMPGGRLLVEHIEEVKTERGIAFVKSNKEDFSNGGDDTPAPANAPVSGVPQVVGGSVVMDASFAETFAKSMASAFKQLPAPTVSSGGAAVSGDFGQAFELIAEEIRASRSSLLDVLKETRNITDSVIASQVSISRILEGILSSQSRDDTATADLNNRIIASQASITKLLESLYTTNTQRNDEVSDYLNVDNKLQKFQSDLTQTFTHSLNDLATNLLKTTAANTQSYDNTSAIDVDRKLAQFRNEIKADVNQSLAEIRQMLFAVNQGQRTNFNISDDTLSSHSNTEFSSVNIPEHLSGEQNSFNDDHKKKKKKKKNGNSNNNQPFASRESLQSVASKVSESTVSANLPKNINENSVIDGVIHNEAYKYDDDFSHINPQEAPLDIEDDVFSSSDITNNSENSLDFLASESDIDTAQQVDNSNESTSFDDFNNADGLDFALPEQNVSPNETSDTIIQSTEDINLDSFTDDDLDFSLPEQNASPNETSDAAIPSTEGINLDSFTDDGLDFALPKQKALPNDTSDAVIPNNENINLDSFTDDGLDFALPEPNDDINSPADDTFVTDEVSGEDINLDSFADGNSDFTSAIDDQNTQSVEDDTFATDEATDENTGLDSFADDNSDFTSAIDGQNTQSVEDDTFLTDEVSDENIGLDSFADDNSDFTLPQSSSEDVDTTTETLDDFSSFDADTSLTDDSVPDEIDEPIQDTSVNNSVDTLDDFTQTDDLDSSLSDDDDVSQDVTDDLSIQSDNVETSEDFDEAIPPEISDEPVQTEQHSRYSAELDKIREALTSDKIDISSLDEPIALDDYSDDENVPTDDDISDTTVNNSQSADDDWEYEYVEDEEDTDTATQVETSSLDNSSGDEDWEWEYVDENGNPIPADETEENADSQDWEWEYVEDDTDENNKDNQSDNNNP